MTFPTRFGRRTLLAGAAAFTTASFALARSGGPAPRDAVSILSALPPDPAPPGVLPYFEDIVSAWETVYNARILMESAAVENLRPKLLLGFQAGAHRYDLVYTAGWVPELSRYLRPLDDILPTSITSDVAPDAFNAGQWSGKRYGVPFTSNVMILYVNAAHLERAGISRPPANWQELKLAAAEMARDGVAGFTMPVGQPEGIGGLAALWMVFLQQAGGRPMDGAGRPIFASDAGVDALQLMVDLFPSQATGSRVYEHLDDATVAFMRGESAMMMNWASMYNLIANSEISRAAEGLTTAVLPAGPEGTATTDSGDAWCITAASWVPEKTMSLLEVYLHPRAQKELFKLSGALPARLSALEDGEVQRIAPHAATVREQLRSPVNSFLTPNYDVMTSILGTSIASALRGELSPVQALRDATGAVSALGGQSV